MKANQSILAYSFHKIFNFLINCKSAYQNSRENITNKKGKSKENKKKDCESQKLRFYYSKADFPHLGYEKCGIARIYYMVTSWDHPTMFHQVDIRLLRMQRLSALHYTLPQFFAHSDTAVVCNSEVTRINQRRCISPVAA